MANEPIITITGNLTADPELKYVGSGIAVASFTVAISERKFNKASDQWEDGDTMFIRCSAWRELGENVTESLSKGMRVIVSGRFMAREFERADGTTGTSLDLQVDEIGPSLKYATAQVTKRTNNGAHAQPGAWSNPNTNTGQTTYNAPQGGSPADPWARQAQQQSAFDGAPPF